MTSPRGRRDTLREIPAPTAGPTAGGLTPPSTWSATDTAPAGLVPCVAGTTGPGTPPASLTPQKRGTGKRGPDRRPRLRKRRVRTEADAISAAALVAAGLSRQRISTALGVSMAMVEGIAKDPGMHAFITKVREAIRAETLAGLQTVQGPILDWIGDSVNGKDAKTFDYVTRGLSALEKVAASASGETRPQPTTVNVVGNVTAEAHELIEALGYTR